MSMGLLDAYKKLEGVSSLYLGTITINGIEYDRVHIECDADEALRSLEDGDGSVIVSLYSKDNDSKNDYYLDAYQLSEATIDYDTFSFKDDDDELVVIKFHAPESEVEVNVNQELFDSFMLSVQEGQTYWGWGSNKYADLNEDGRVYYNTHNLEFFFFDTAEDFAKWWFLDDQDVEFEYSFTVGERDDDGNITLNCELEEGWEVDESEDCSDVTTVMKRITEKERTA